MSRVAQIPAPSRTLSLRAAVLDLLAQAAPRPAALGTPSAEEQEFLDTLRRIVARSAAEDLWCRYHSARPDSRGPALAFTRYDD
jgi:hypothetical protein